MNIKQFILLVFAFFCAGGVGEIIKKIIGIDVTVFFIVVVIIIFTYIKKK